MRVSARGIGRNDGLTAAFGQPITQPPGIIGTVGNELARDRDGAEVLLGADKVMGIARRHAQREGPSQRVGQRVDFARAAPARASDGIGEGPPFAPPAER